MEGHLKLSVNFVNGTYARNGRFVSIDKAELMELPFSTSDKPIKAYKGLWVGRDEILELGDEVISVRGVWDLAMIGGEKLDVQRRFQELISGPEATNIMLEGAFVRTLEGHVVQLLSL